MPRRSTHAKRAVTILINGRNLIPMVRKRELPFAEAEDARSIAGGYGPRSVEEFKKDHAEVVAGTHYKPKLSLYACRDCGEVGCEMGSGSAKLRCLTPFRSP